MWGPKLWVGVKDIDDQHKKLVEIVNKLNDAMVAGHGREVIGPTLNELIRYTQQHFAAEERIMLSLDPPGANGTIARTSRSADCAKTSGAQRAMLTRRAELQTRGRLRPLDIVSDT